MAIPSASPGSSATLMEQNLSVIGLHQIFVESPEGVWIELNFKPDDYLSGKEGSGH